MKRSLLQVAVLTTALAVAMAMPALGAPEAYEVVVKQVSSTSMQWTTNQEFGRATLHVTGPKHYDFSRTFKDDVLAYFKLYDGSEDPRDGTYRWTLNYVSPVDSELAAAIADARKDNNICFIDEITEAGIFASGQWSGTFLVLNGKMIVPESQEEEEDRFVGDTDLKGKADEGPGTDVNALPTKDFVINDDLIVDGSACIGFDCVNGESFSFDTIRLKENNLRIKFDDTSVAASFPRNDWQITANDSANGGASKFSIDDISGGRTPFTIEANARSHSLYVDDGGRIGIRTSTPSTEIHVIDGDTPTLRLQQDGSSGFAPQTWDVAGNETNFFIRDVTNGSALPFRIRPGAPTSSVFIGPEGNVGVNTTSPDVQFHAVESGSAGDLRIVGAFENNGPASLQLLDSNSGDNWVFSNKVAGFEISKGGTGVIEFNLDGSGNLTIEGQLTTGSNVYPDYVFDEGYELMPLDDLAAFIQTNGHLPNIKSEEEVSFGKRVNISELQVGLLEKVEELTLYTLDQHKADRELRQADEALLEIVEKQNELIRQLEARWAALEAGN